MSAVESLREIGVYIHIPFCRRVCPYCDFVRTQIVGGVPDEFLSALEEQVRNCPVQAKVKTMYFGGGTPSLLSPDQLYQILEIIDSRFLRPSGITLADLEITLEANPDDVSKELVAAWQQMGINRISLGVQSFSDAVLQYLGRRHDAETALLACECVAASFPTWNIDLIYGAHPVSEWEPSLQLCKALKPPHISVYGLTYEESTPFGQRKSEEIDDDLSLQLYRFTREKLADTYQHYEISNFALTGHECRHNLIYWQNEEYLGFGPGAYSFVNEVRSRNTSSFPEYVQFPLKKEEEIFLTDREVRIETLIQHFRLKRGLSQEYYFRRFGTKLIDDFGEKLEILTRRGLLREEGDYIKPTEIGFELNNEIGLVLVE